MLSRPTDYAKAHTHASKHGLYEPKELAALAESHTITQR